jgi:hypothetical protein
MAIENRTLPVGTRLVASYKKTQYVCTVEQSEDGKVEYALETGQRFKSPSAAGSAVMNGMACNGWRFWSLESESKAQVKAATSTTPKADKQGRIRWTCPAVLCRLRRVPHHGQLAGDAERLPERACGNQRRVLCRRSTIKRTLGQAERPPHGGLSRRGTCSRPDQQR